MFGAGVWVLAPSGSMWFCPRLTRTGPPLVQLVCPRLADFRALFPVQGSPRLWVRLPVRNFASQPGTPP